MSNVIRTVLSRQNRSELMHRIAEGKEQISLTKGRDKREWLNAVLQDEASMVFYGYAKPDELRRALDEICPNPESREVITFRRKRYRCRYFEIEAEHVSLPGRSYIRKIWGRFWEPISKVPAPFARARKKANSNRSY